MTGYGKAVVAYKDKKINVEIKSLNSKALDLNARIAPLYREKEMEMRQMVAQALIRGKVDFSIWIEKEEGVDATPINKALVGNYFSQMQSLAKEYGIPEPSDWFASLMRMPDVMTKTDVEVLIDEEWAVVRKAIEQALTAIVDFRIQEGAALQKSSRRRSTTSEHSWPASSLMSKAVWKRSATVSSRVSRAFPKWNTTRTGWSRNSSTTLRNSTSARKNSVSATT